MIGIKGSHGGRDTTASYAEALGMFLLAINGIGGWDRNLVRIDDVGYHFRYKGKHYRGIWEKKFPGTPVETWELHFDYLREDPDSRIGEEQWELAC